MEWRVQGEKIKVIQLCGTDSSQPLCDGLDPRPLQKWTAPFVTTPDDKLSVAGEESTKQHWSGSPSPFSGKGHAVVWEILSIISLHKEVCFKSFLKGVHAVFRSQMGW